MMKNEVLLRYKRARWHSVIGDSSIHRAARDTVNKSKTTDRIPSPLMGEESKVRVKKTTPTTRARHSRVGGNPQGVCVVPGTVILALRQYP